jgi:hypothetical protein
MVNWSDAKDFNGPKRVMMVLRLAFVIFVAFSKVSLSRYDTVNSPKQSTLDLIHRTA